MRKRQANSQDQQYIINAFLTFCRIYWVEEIFFHIFIFSWDRAQSKLNNKFQSGEWVRFWELQIKYRKTQQQISLRMPNGLSKLIATKSETHSKQNGGWCFDKFSKLYPKMLYMYYVMLKLRQIKMEHQIQHINKCMPNHMDFALGSHFLRSMCKCWVVT